MLVPLEHAQFLQSVEPVWYVELLPSVLLACRAPPVAQAKERNPPAPGTPSGWFVSSQLAPNLAGRESHKLRAYDVSLRRGTVLRKHRAFPSSH